MGVNIMLRYRALDRQVLIVAVVNTIVGDWSAYIGAVPGECHEDEYEEVAAYGTKLSKELATVLFPDLAKKYKWRK